MIVRCCICEKKLREKPPYKDRSFTDTYCRLHELKELLRNGLATDKETNELSLRYAMELVVDLYFRGHSFNQALGTIKLWT